MIVRTAGGISMPGTKVKIGPWQGGLNLSQDSQLIGDNELTTCNNFDVEDDGRLVPRRGFKAANAGLPNPADLRILGSITSSNLLYGVASTRGDGVNSRFYYFLQGNFQETTWTGSFSAIYTSIAQYNGVYYVTPELGTLGFSATSFFGATTARPTMPAGDLSFIFQERLFIVDKSTSRIYYSKATDPTIWSAPDGGFFDVSPRDGEDISAVVATNTNITIFKPTATYVFDFTSDPATDGLLRLISSDTGALGATVFNNEIYVVNSRSVFKFINNYFQDIAQQLDMANRNFFISPLPVGIYVVDTTLLVEDSFNSGFLAMNLLTGAWSTYTFNTPMAVSGLSTKSCQFNGGSDFYTAFVGLFSSTDIVIIKHRMKVSNQVPSFVDKNSVGQVTIPAYSFRTKDYEFGDFEQWKRLYWWAINTEEGADGRPSGTPQLFVNELTVAFTDDLIDKVMSLSARFRSLAFGLTSTSSVVTNETIDKNIVVKNITTYVNAKAPIVV